MNESGSTAARPDGFPPSAVNIMVGGAVSGEVGYRAYGDAVGWTNYLGRPMPEWADLPEQIQTAWGRAAIAIVDAAYQFGAGYAHLDAVCHAAATSDTGTICACGHSSYLHDIDEADGSGAQCCVDGCSCETGR